jgi:hypothetical protein
MIVYHWCSEKVMRLCVLLCELVYCNEIEASNKFSVPKLCVEDYEILTLHLHLMTQFHSRIRSCSMCGTFTTLSTRRTGNHLSVSFFCGLIYAEVHVQLGLGLIICCNTKVYAIW